MQGGLIHIGVSTRLLSRCLTDYYKIPYGTYEYVVQYSYDICATTAAYDMLHRYSVHMIRKTAV